MTKKPRSALNGDGSLPRPVSAKDLQLGLTPQALNTVKDFVSSLNSIKPLFDNPQRVDFLWDANLSGEEQGPLGDC